LILKNAHVKVVVQYIPPPNTNEKVELVWMICHFMTGVRQLLYHWAI